MHKWVLLAVAGILLFAAVAVSSQQNVAAASISGTVTDPASAVVPGAAVIITDRSTGRTTTVTTDTAGHFLIEYVPVGDYTIRVAKSGFQPQERSLTATVGQSLVYDTSLKVAGVDTTIDVTSDAEVIERSRTPVAETVTSHEIDRLPLNGRNFLDLALLVPGVSRTNTGTVQKFAETSAVPGTGISTQGQRNLDTSFIVDGTSANDDSVELAGTFYSQEVIREFEVVTNGASAEYGRASSGFVSIITRSGGNRFDGRVYGFLRNQRLDARNPLAARRDPLTQVQAGATFSGPVKRDRTFFFTNFESTRRQDSSVVTISPASVASINTRLDALNFAGPRIATGIVSGGYKSYSYFARIDHKLTDHTDLAVTYNLYDINAVNARTVGGLNAVSRGTDLANTDHTINTQLISTLRPNVLNEFRFEYRRSRLAAPANDNIGPAVNISGVASLGTATSSPTRRDIDLVQFSDSLTIVRHAHTIKTGAELVYNDLNIEFPGAVTGLYSFNNLAAFLTGSYSQFQQSFGAVSQRQRVPAVGLFVQDAWQIGRKLTFDLGIRYDLQFLPSPIRTDKNNVSPRFGFAYSPASRTVIRGSIGVFYDRIPTRATSNALQRDGSRYLTAIFLASTPGAPVFPGILAIRPAALVIKPSITRIDPDIESGQSTQASIQIERELPWSVSASVGYLHLRGRHIMVSRNVNVPTCTDAAQNLCRPDPNFGNISRYESSGDSWYDGMIVELHKSAGNWFETRLSYTLSKSLDDAGNFFFSTPQDNADLRADKGLSDNDQRHQLSFSGGITVPRASDRAFARRLASGIRLSWIYTYASPLPFNILLGVDRNGDTNNNDRPIGVARNTGRGFDLRSLDVRISRTVSFTEKKYLELLVEGFNILNRSNLSVPNNTFGTGTVPVATFGEPTQAFDPRQIQVGFRLTF